MVVPVTDNRCTLEVYLSDIGKNQPYRSTIKQKSK